MPPLLRSQIALAALLLSSFAATASAQSETKAAPVRGGSSPEEAVALMARSAKAGDVDATFGVLVDDQSRPMLAWVRASGEVARAINAFVDAADAAFGKDPNSQMKRVDYDPKRDLASGFVNLTVSGPAKMVDAEHATIVLTNSMKAPNGQVMTRDEPAKALKTPAGWKLSFDSFEMLDFAAAAKHLASVRDALDRTTKLVKEGKIKLRDEAGKELERDQPKQIPGNYPLPRFLTGQR